jgi:hypothetical protein
MRYTDVFEGDVVDSDPEAPHCCGASLAGVAMMNKLSTGVVEVGTYYHPLGKMLKPFAGKRVRLQIIVEELVE